jgi:flagellar hook-basal body complex protein FliE
MDPLGASPIGPSGPGTPGDRGPKEPTQPGESFVDLLKNSINEVNQMKHNAGNKMQKLVTGEISNVHEVMIAAEEASVASSLLLQVRNQLLKAWNELRRAPV